MAGERVKLTVRFSDGAAPESASFWLVGHSVRGARRVEVFRHARPPDELKREAAKARAEARQCQEDKARLLAERIEPGGLMGAAWLERTSAVQWRDIRAMVKQHSGNALRLRGAKSHHFQGHVDGATIAVRWEGECPPGRRWVRDNGRPRRIPRAHTRRNERGLECNRGAFHAAQPRDGDGAPHARACPEFAVD
ncbi:DUF2381 family protein [Cystobacter fuscus]|uniref:DUF2381 family protein n=1 Tax=Cystobacter fuscus TaxID=43 RepID=UPI0037C05714